MPVQWKAVRRHFEYTIEWWNERGSPNYKRGLLYGQQLWEELIRRDVLRSVRPNDVDTKVWLMTLVRLWRDVNIEPGLTVVEDDWWGIADGLDFHPERLVEADSERCLDDVFCDVELRMMDVWSSLGRHDLERIVRPFQEALGANGRNSTAWVNFEYTMRSRREAEVQRAVIFRPRIACAHAVLIEHLQRYPRDLQRLSPYRFEDLIAELLGGRGFSVSLSAALDESKPGDHGRDILAWNEDANGRYLLIVDTKRYRETRPVGVSAVRGLLGAVVDEEKRTKTPVSVRGMLVTSSYFSPEAHRFQRRHEYRISLKGYDDVVNWLKGHPV